MNTTPVELCGYCVATVEHGAGEAWRVDALWRKYGGRLVVFLSRIMTTFRACDGCGVADGTVRYEAATYDEEESDD